MKKSLKAIFKALFAVIAAVFTILGSILFFRKRKEKK